ncbi:aromatic amino acid lyase [Streptomyces sp. NPDC093591]|uniref:aromatic amino acid lyase n=1 Tax=Streptomyces sp. NPDC093591 TaxID=3366044 RepID=UPI0037FBC952
MHLTMPAGSFSRSTESHSQIKVGMGTIAARHARTAIGLAVQVAAIHLLALAQATDLHRPPHLAPATRTAHTVLRQHSASVEQDRPLDADIPLVTDLINTAAIRSQVSIA